MRKTIYPQFDEHDAETLSDERGELLARKAWDDFLERHRLEWAPYNSAENMELMKGFLTGQVVPMTLRNLEIAFRAFIDDGTLKKQDETDFAGIEAAQEFMRQCPEYAEIYANRANSETLQSYLTRHKLAVTVENSQAAFSYCLAHSLLRPAQTNFYDMKKAVFVRDSVTPEDRSEYADRPFESDVARKKRDEQLRRAAIADRIAHRKASQ
jgi:hypothetical protein